MAAAGGSSYPLATGLEGLVGVTKEDLGFGSLVTRLRLSDANSIELVRAGPLAPHIDSSGYGRTEKSTVVTIVASNVSDAALQLLNVEQVVHDFLRTVSSEHRRVKQFVDEQSRLDDDLLQ